MNEIIDITKAKVIGRNKMNLAICIGKDESGRFLQIVDFDGEVLEKHYCRNKNYNNIFNKLKSSY